MPPILPARPQVPPTRQFGFYTPPVPQEERYSYILPQGYEMIDFRVPKEGDIILGVFNEYNGLKHFENVYTHGTGPIKELKHFGTARPILRRVFNPKVGQIVEVRQTDIDIWERRIFLRQDDNKKIICARDARTYEEYFSVIANNERVYSSEWLQGRIIGETQPPTYGR